MDRLRLRNHPSQFVFNSLSAVFVSFILICFYTVGAYADSCKWLNPQAFACEDENYIYGTAYGCADFGTNSDVFCNVKNKDDLNKCNADKSEKRQRCYKKWDASIRKSPDAGSNVTCVWRKDTNPSKTTCDNKTYYSGFVSCTDDAEYIGFCKEANFSDSKKCVLDRDDNTLRCYEIYIQSINNGSETDSAVKPNTVKQRPVKTKPHPIKSSR